jgi:hypothetical protein
MRVRGVLTEEQLFTIADRITGNSIDFEDALRDFIMDDINSIIGDFMNLTGLERCSECGEWARLNSDMLCEDCEPEEEEEDDDSDEG